MSELHLDSLEIKNFRCFEHLTIEKLGRVNLIVGKNSVGKTALLEAIRIFANRGNPSIIFDILGYRNEIEYSTLLMDNTRQVDLFSSSEADMDSAIKYMFNGRHYEFGDTFSINSEKTRLSLGVALYAYSEEQSELGKRLIGPVLLEDYDKYEELKPRISISIDGSHRHSMPLFFENRRIPPRRNEGDDSIICQFIPVSGLEIRSITAFWERVSLTNSEKEIVENLNKVVPDLSGINIAGYSERSPSRSPFIIARIKEQIPVPLKSLGDGLYRAFGISLALASSSGGLLLIDEFETGLHHSVQADIWRVLFETAKRMNVQVFATTHSWDCIEAFQEVAAEDQNEEAMLISLQQRKAGIKAVSFGERELNIATRGHIEVR
jgi:AAA15 family ATPase/GTPase